MGMVRNVIDIFAVLPQTGDTGDRASKARDYRRILEDVWPAHVVSNGQAEPACKGVTVNGNTEDGDVYARWRSVNRDGIGKLYEPFGGMSQEIRSIMGTKG